MKKRFISFLMMISLICLTACGTQQEPVQETTETQQTDNAVTEKTIPAADVKEAPLTDIDRLIAETNDKVTLKVWVPGDETDLTRSMIETFKAEYKDVEFDISIEAKAEDDIYDSVSGERLIEADVFEFSDALLPGYAKEGLLAEADAAYIYDVTKEDTKGAVKAASYDGKVLAYPVSVYNGCFMYYDDTVFSESDTESLETMSEKAKAAGKKIAFEMDNAWYLYAFFGAEGSGLELSLSSDGISNECNWNGQGGEDIANAIIDNIKNGALEAVQSNDEAVTGFEKGKYCALVGGPWSVEDIKGSVSGNLAAAKLPTFEAGGKLCRMVSFAGYRMLGVNSECKYTEWAKLLAEYLSSKDAQLKRYGVTGACPAWVLSDADTITSNDAVTRALNAQSDHADPLRIGTNYYAPAAMLGEALSDGNSSGVSVKELLRRAAEGINSEVME